MAKYVVYDSLNGNAWVDHGYKGKKLITRDLVTHGDNRTARAAAIRYAKEHNVRVYDKYYGKYLPKSATSNQPRRTVRAQPQFSPFGGGRGRGGFNLLG